jgi:hypothetical protein
VFPRRCCLSGPFRKKSTSLIRYMGCRYQGGAVKPLSSAIVSAVVRCKGETTTRAIAWEPVTVAPGTPAPPGVSPLAQGRARASRRRLAARRGARASTRSNLRQTAPLCAAAHPAMPVSGRLCVTDGFRFVTEE